LAPHGAADLSPNSETTSGRRAAILLVRPMLPRALRSMTATLGCAVALPTAQRGPSGRSIVDQATRAFRCRPASPLASTARTRPIIRSARRSPAVPGANLPCSVSPTPSSRRPRRAVRLPAVRALSAAAHCDRLHKMACRSWCWHGTAPAPPGITDTARARDCARTITAKPRSGPLRPIRLGQNVSREGRRRIADGAFKFATIVEGRQNRLPILY
jgi:hypothetical protein